MRISCAILALAGARRNRVRVLWLVALIALALAPAAQAMKVTLAGGVTFPYRSLVLSVPSSAPLTTQRVHLTENRGPVSQLSVTSLKTPGHGDFGLIVVIDTDRSMNGAPLNEAFAAARTLAAERSPNQDLGVVFGNRTTLPLTTDPAAIDRALTHAPPVVSQTNLLKATEAAITQLKTAGIAAGAVIFVSDDIDRAPNYTPASVAAFANSAHVRVFTVGVQDPAFVRPSSHDLPPQTMAQFARAAGGFFTKAAPSKLRRIFTQIEAGLISEYVVRYRSRQPLGRRVRLTVRVDGVPGTFATSYETPAPLKLGASRPSSARPGHGSFWHSWVALGLAAVGCALLTLIAVFVVATYLAGLRRPVPERVNEFLPAPPPRHPVGDEAEARLGEEVLSRRAWWPSFVEQVDIARINRSALDLVYLAGLGSCIAAVLIFLITGSTLIALLGLFLGPIGLRSALAHRIQQQRSAFSDQFPTYLEEVAGAVRSGRSTVEALGIVAVNSDQPLRREFDLALRDERLGLPLDETLRPIATRMKADGVEQLAVITALQRRTGSGVAEVLDRIAEAARERNDVQRDLRAMTAQGRLARWILTALPPLLMLAFAIINPRYERPMFHTAGGIIALVVGAVMVTLGSLVMKRIVEIEI